MLLSFTIIIITTLGLSSITVVGLAGDRIVLAQPKNPQQEDEDIANNKDGDGGNNEDLSSSTTGEEDGENSDGNNNAEITSPTIDAQKVCRKGDVLADNHDPGKFKLLSRCEEVFGVIEKDEGRQHDGDLKYLLDVGDEYKYLLNDENDAKTDGMLVIEINPKDQDSSKIEIPEVGDRVRVVGAWVTDGETLGWNEIHPAWQIEILEESSF
jgi:hypothetical protein